MGTFVEAVIFDGGPGAAAVPPGLRTVPLEPGLTMLPVTSELLTRVDPAALGHERIPPAGCCGSRWWRWPARCPADRRVLYIVSETAGGHETKEAIAWSCGRLIHGPSGTCDIEEDFEPGYHLAPLR